MRILRLLTYLITPLLIQPAPAHSGCIDVVQRSKIQSYYKRVVFVAAKIHEATIKVNPHARIEDARSQPLVPTDLQIKANGAIIFQLYFDRISAIVTPLGSFPVIGALGETREFDYPAALASLGFKLRKIEVSPLDLSFPRNARGHTFFAIEQLPDGTLLPPPIFKMESEMIPPRTALSEWKKYVPADLANDTFLEGLY